MENGICDIWKNIFFPFFFALIISPSAPLNLHENLRFFNNISIAIWLQVRVSDIKQLATCNLQRP